MRTKHTFRLPADLMTRLTDYAARKGATQSLVVEAALASHLSPDGADRLEAALAEHRGSRPAAPDRDWWCGDQGRRIGRRHCDPAQPT